MFNELRDWVADDPVADGIFRRGGLLYVWRDEAPQELIAANPEAVYCVFYVVSETSPQYFDGPPGMDRYRIQCSVFGPAMSGVDAARSALRDVIESRGYTIGGTTARDPATRRYMATLDFSTWVTR